MEEDQGSTEHIYVDNEFFVSIFAPISHSASFVLGIVLLKDLVSTFRWFLNLHTLPKLSQNIRPRLLSFIFVRIIQKAPSIRPPDMKCSNIITSALIHLASLAYAAPAVEARQEFEVSITFIGEGSTYFQQFPTDNQPYPIGKSSPLPKYRNTQNSHHTYPFISKKAIRKRTSFSNSLNEAPDPTLTSIQTTP